MIKFVSFMSGALVLASSFSAQAGCDIYDSGIGARGSLTVMIDGTSYPTVEDLLLAVKADPTLLDLVKPSGSESSPGPGVVDPMYPSDREHCAVEVSDNEQCVKGFGLWYVPPDRKETVGGDTHWPIYGSGFDHYFRNNGAPEGVKAPLILNARADKYTYLERVMRALPACGGATGVTSATGAARTRRTTPATRASAANQTPPADSVEQAPGDNGGYERVNGASDLRRIRGSR